MSTVVYIKQTYGKLRVPFAGLDEGSNPTEAEFELSLDGVDRRRRVFCRRQDRCLDFAASENWVSYHCANCSVRENMTSEENFADLDGLAGVLNAMGLWPGARSVDTDPCG